MMDGGKVNTHVQEGLKYLKVEGRSEELPPGVPLGASAGEEARAQPGPQEPGGKWASGT